MKRQRRTPYDDHVAHVNMLLERFKNQPKRCETNICGIEGDCLRCFAWSGESCRKILFADEQTKTAPDL